MMETNLTMMVATLIAESNPIGTVLVLIPQNVLPKADQIPDRILDQIQNPTIIMELTWT